MSPQEPRRELLPSRLADVTPIAAISARSDRFDNEKMFDSTTFGSTGSAFEWVGRAFRRHWWQILPLWLIGSAALWWWIPQWFPNSYQSTAEVQIEAGQGGDAKTPANDFATFKETQARRIVSPKIIADALADHPELGKQLAGRTEKTDQETAILNGISAILQPNTNLIQVTMRAANDDGLAAIVNGVIQAYLAVSTDFNQEGVAQRTIKFRNMLRAKEDQVAVKRGVVEKLVVAKGDLDANQGRERHKAELDTLADLTDQALKTDLEVVEEEARLNRIKQDEAKEAAGVRPEALIKSDAAKAFYLLPEVRALTEQLDQVRQSLVRVDREPGKVSAEPDRKVLREKSDSLQRQVDNLWSRLSPDLVVAAQNEPKDGKLPESSKLESRLIGLKARQVMLNQRLESLKETTLSGGSELLALEFARQDLNRAETVLESMTQTNNQNEVASNQPIARFRQEYEAKTTEKSAILPRLLIGITGPLLGLFGLLSFFGLIEKRTGRILDPADLPAKARLNVIGLVPPLPKNRTKYSLTAAKEAKSQADVERFIQSLDQLRVLVCGRSDRDGRPRRSLLITSAGENEGKSTLAAQLAERSVNAGLVTLLIDADLRNPTLSRMFDRPDSVGLANVLRGELLAEEAIVTVAEAGGFHFLPAGLVRDDLSRLLGSDRLGRLLESARESFDLVLIDSPPVLPVADALTIGQWVDGAILTVRHKTSRLPLVDRASRQLASVGVTVLGAVVSGVKDRYAPYYGSRPASDPVRDGSTGSSS